MVKEAQNLTATYSDGVGIYAFTPDDLKQRYVPVSVSTDAAARVTTLDEVLDEIAGEIKERMEEHDNRVPPARPSQTSPGVVIPDDDQDQLTIF